VHYLHFRFISCILYIIGSQSLNIASNFLPKK